MKRAQTRSKVASNPPTATKLRSLPPASPAATRGFIKLRGPAHPAAQRLFTKSHGSSMEVKVQKMSQRAATRTDPGAARLGERD